MIYFITGNDILHELTDYHSQRLKIILSDFADITKQADYGTFHVSSELLDYRLNISGVSGDAGMFIKKRIRFLEGS